MSGGSQYHGFKVTYKEHCRTCAELIDSRFDGRVAEGFDRCDELVTFGLWEDK